MPTNVLPKPGGQTEVTDWLPSTSYTAGTLRNVTVGTASFLIKCVTSHTSAATWSAATAANWGYVSQDIVTAAYVANGVYLTGAKVTEGNVIYRRTATGTDGATFVSANWTVDNPLLSGTVTLANMKRQVNANQSITVGTSTQITNWNTILHNVGGATSSNGGFVASRAGRYSVSTTIGYAWGTGTGQFEASIRKNGTEQSKYRSFTSTSGTHVVTHSDTVDCAAGDVISIWAYADGVTGPSVTTASTFSVVEEPAQSIAVATPGAQTPLSILQRLKPTASQTVNTSPLTINFDVDAVNDFSQGTKITHTNGTSNFTLAGGTSGTTYKLTGKLAVSGSSSVAGAYVFYRFYNATSATDIGAEGYSTDPDNGASNSGWNEIDSPVAVAYVTVPASTSTIVRLRITSQGGATGTVRDQSGQTSVTIEEVASNVVTTGTSNTTYYMRGNLTGSGSSPSISVVQQIGGSAISGGTFTAPRTGIYRISVTAASNVTWASDNYWMLIASGTCAQGVATQRFGFVGVKAGHSTYSGVSGSIDCYMTTGQTFALSVYCGGTTPSFGNPDSTITITEVPLNFYS
jgi:hypothetical protein